LQNVHFHYIIYLSANQPIQEVTMPTVTVKVTALIPTVDYGNLGFELTQEVELPESGASANHAVLIQGATNSLRLQLAMSVLPLVEAEVVRASSVLMKDATPDAFMRRNCKVYNWFVITNPDVRIPAMERILANRQTMDSVDKFSTQFHRGIPVGTGGMEDQMEASEEAEQGGIGGTSWEDMDKASKK
jgi:hypothetical protein